MTNRMCSTFTAVVFALLAFTAPAQAALIEGSFSGIVTSGATVGDPVSGTFSYDSTQLYPPFPVLGRGYIWANGSDAISYHACPVDAYTPQG